MTSFVHHFYILITKQKQLASIGIDIFSFIILGKTQNFQNAFEGTTTEVGDIAVAILNGTYSYGGW